MYICTDCIKKTGRAPNATMQLHDCSVCGELRACFIYKVKERLNNSTRAWVISQPVKVPGVVRSFDDPFDPEVIETSEQLERERYLVKFNQAAEEAREKFVEIISTSDIRRIRDVDVEFRIRTI